MPRVVKVSPYFIQVSPPHDQAPKTVAYEDYLEVALIFL